MRTGIALAALAAAVGLVLLAARNAPVCKPGDSGVTLGGRVLLDGCPPGR